MVSDSTTLRLRAVPGYGVKHHVRPGWSQAVLERPQRAPGDQAPVWIATAASGSRILKLRLSSM
jgi:hypothetical protein